MRFGTTIENYISELIETGSAPQTAFVEFTKTPASENTSETPATEENVPPSENHESAPAEAPAEAPSEVPDVPAPEIAENPESIENTTPEEV